MSITPLLIGFLSIIVPGFFLALALLRKTEMHIVEIAIIGFIFGLIFPPTMIWLEGYLIPYIPSFSFSAGLYNINVIILTIAGIALAAQQGAFKMQDIREALKPKPTEARQASASAEQDYKSRISELRSGTSRISLDLKIVKAHEQEEAALAKKHSEELVFLRTKGAGSEELRKIEEAHKEEERRLFEQHEREERNLLKGASSATSIDKKAALAWLILFALMIATFASRIINIGVAPKFFEFDPYFDMISTEYILTYGYQLEFDHSAWPVDVNGTIHRIQPIVPYLEAYWYQLETNNQNAINTNLLSSVSSVYPPITAALLVFVIFFFVDRLYGKFPALIVAGLTATMPTLISTFIAGEQLVEPWGIFTLFFFFATYILAVRNPKEKRYSILAGIAFASTFLGAHYYTVTAGALAIYIVAQGFIDVLRNKSSTDFYIMNAWVLGTIIIFYALYSPYGATLTERIPNLLYIPTIVAFPLFALMLVGIFEYLPVIAKKYNIIKDTGRIAGMPFYYTWFIILLVLVVLLILFTPLGRPIKAYAALSVKFTTPSSPLFMTVQEYEPTGLNFDFGNAGFGIIGAKTGADLLIWLALIIFGTFEVLNIYYRNSKSSILSLVIVFALGAAGMSEVKYLPHFGVAYIIAIGVIIGELIRITEKSKGEWSLRAVYAVGIAAVLLESGSVAHAFSANGQSCSTIAKNNDVIGYNLFCNSVPNAWLSAMAWVRANVGPLAPRILSWWDYGDWINWFGNSNAVIRGDNAVAKLDYAVAAHFVLGINNSYGPSELGLFMNSMQTRYVLFDDQLIPKWSALDFLACVHINQTSQAFAYAQAQQYRSYTSAPYVLGTSKCEFNHDPVYINIPQNPTVTDYCPFSNSTVTAVRSIITTGETLAESLNQTYCMGTAQNSAGIYPVYTTDGKPTNIVVDPMFYYGARNAGGGVYYLDFLALYLPNGPNYTVTDAPTDFYNSNFYRGYIFGKLPGFTLVYPKNFVGLNYVNGTVNTVMIFQLNNYTGGTPYVTPKPPWVSNNYTMPG